MNARVTPLRNEAENALVAAFGAVRPTLAGGASAARLREEAFARFLRVGLPHRRVEAWHYTDLRAALREVLPLAEAPSTAVLKSVHAGLEARISSADVTRLVLVDGAYMPDLSDIGKLPAGVVIRTLPDALAQDGASLLAPLPDGAFGNDDAALALNAAFANNGLVIDVAAGTRVAHAIEIVSITSAARPQSMFVRSLVRLGRGAALRLIETHAGSGESAVQKNDALIVDLAAESELAHVATFSASAESIHVSSVLARIDARARFTSFALVTGAGLLRRQGFLRFEGDHAKAELTGVNLLRGRQHADTTLVVHHVAPHCESREYFKHILDGAATGVFQGKVVVAPDAQKTDGVMKSRAILLSEDATMNNKPELEIFADDVVCGHGATCGALDADQVFYAQSRGLPRPVAEAMLLEAFATEAVERVEDMALREMLLDKVRAWLGERSL